MNLQGLQKLTLLDFPGKTACTLFTGGCNLRCPFCHNAALIVPPNAGEIDEEDFFAFLASRRGKLDGVAITGGEPLAQRDIAPFLSRVRELGFLIKLDTNGFYPDALKALIDEGLVDYVAMDLKNSDGKYAATCGREGLDLAPMKKSVRLLMESGVDYEFRTTVIREYHTVADIEAIARGIAGAPRYYLQQFKDSGILAAGTCSAHDEATLIEMRDRARKYIPTVEIRGI
jgi:pyruvate formate lyase activating enzyme